MNGSEIRLKQQQKMSTFFGAWSDIHLEEWTTNDVVWCFSETYKCSFDTLLWLFLYFPQSGFI